MAALPLSLRPLMKLYLVHQHLLTGVCVSIYAFRPEKLTWSLELAVSSNTKYLFFHPKGTIYLEPKYMELTHKIGILEGRHGRKPADCPPAACHALLASNKDLDSSGFYRWAPWLPPPHARGAGSGHTASGGESSNQPSLIFQFTCEFPPPTRGLRTKAAHVLENNRN